MDPPVKPGDDIVEERGVADSSSEPRVSPKMALWKRYLIGVGLFTGFVGVLTCFGENGLIKVIHLARRHSSIEERIEKLKAENADLDEQTERLRKKEHYMEESVRNVLGFVKEDEVIYEFDRPTPTPVKKK